MNRAEMRLRIRDSISEETAGYWSDAELDRYIADGINSMCEVRGMEALVRIVISDDKRAPVPATPTQMTFIDQLWLYSVPGTVTISEIAPVAPVSGDAWVVESTMVYSTYDGAAWVALDLPPRTDLERTVDSIEDGYIKFTAKQSGLLELVGYRLPLALTDDTTECEIPAPFVLGVVEYAISKAASKDENKPKIEEHLANFFNIKRKWEAKRSYKRSHFVDTWMGKLG